MLFRFKNIIVDIDAEATRKFCREHDMINNCACDGCENYRQWAAEHCSSAIREQFRQFGIDDMRVFWELGLPYTDRAFYARHGKLHYWGWYHVIGCIPKLTGDASRKVIKDCSQPAEDFQIFPAFRAELVSPEFPRPVLQLDIQADIPWVLKESVEENLV